MTQLRVLASTVLLAIALAGQVPRSGSLSDVHPHLVYTAEVRGEDRRAFHFEIEVTAPPPEEARFVIPYWAPGAYRPLTTDVRSGSPAWEHLEGFEAEDDEGRPLPVAPDGPRAWKVETRGRPLLRFRYRNAAPGRRPNNRSFLDQETGLIDGPRSWMYLEGHKDRPAHVHFRLPPGWSVGTGLDPTFDPFVFHADDYDRLADCPTAVGRFHERVFHVRGVPHRVLALSGSRSEGAGLDDFVEKVRRIVEVYVGMFNDVPHQHYTFIYTDGGGGGLEHLTSTTISAGRTDTLGDHLLSVTAHEFFHTWNVKRLRPFLLGPFDYTGPVRVRDLWICEGLTSYYTNLGLWRAGLVADERFLAIYSQLIAEFVQNPASLYVSPEQSSWMVWDRGGTPISYYLQGEVLGLLMDLAIREASPRGQGLDDAMRRMYRNFGGYDRHGPALPGFRSEDFPAAIKAETGVDLDAFFDAHIRGSEPVDWNRWLRSAGWELETEEREMPALAAFRRGERTDGGVRVAVEGADLLGRLGFEDGDVVVRWDGREIRTPRELQTRLRGLRVGATFSATVNRRGTELAVEGPVEAASEFGALVVRDVDGEVHLAGVPAGTALFRAGLRNGDAVVSVDGRILRDAGELRDRLAEKRLGSSAAFRVRRERTELDIEVPALPRRMVRTGPLREIPDATSRMLAVRAGLKAAAATPVPAGR